MIIKPRPDINEDLDSMLDNPHRQSNFVGEIYSGIYYATVHITNHIRCCLKINQSLLITRGSDVKQFISISHTYISIRNRI